MRERSLDEFESIFEHASIPVLRIDNIELKRTSTIVRGDPLDESVLNLAAHLGLRFGVEVRIHWPATASVQHALEAARSRGFQPADTAFASTAELVGQVSIARAQLVLLPEPQDDNGCPVDLDKIVQGVAPPVLLIRKAIDKPAATFRNILHSLTGNFQQTQNFAYSFTLAEERGTLLLLHAVDSAELEDVREALQVAPDIALKSGDELLEEMAHHGERFLKAVVAASRGRPFDVSYRLKVGDVVAAVRAELERGDYGLLVVGSHREGQSHLAASDYQLMHIVRDIPVLAL